MYSKFLAAFRVCLISTKHFLGESLRIRGVITDQFLRISSHRVWMLKPLWMSGFTKTNIETFCLFILHYFINTQVSRKTLNLNLIFVFWITHFIIRNERIISCLLIQALVGIAVAVTVAFTPAKVHTNSLSLVKVFRKSLVSSLCV